MDYREIFNKEEHLIKERFALAKGRIGEIASGEDSEMGEELKRYFCFVANFLMECYQMYQNVEDGSIRRFTTEELKRENYNYYKDILPENYEHSYANPAYAVKELGEQYGRILSFLYTELRSFREYIFIQNRTVITILSELFLEIYGMFLSEEEVTYRNLKETMYWFFYDFADLFVGWRVREMVDPSLKFATDIVMNSNLENLRYLYAYGDYISEKEWEMAAFMNRLSQEEVEQIARTFTEGYREGFVLKNVDLSKKQTVNIQYPIGYERIIRAAISQFRKMGLEPVLFGAALNTLNKRQNLRIGYISSNPNEQYHYDHRFDEAIYLDKRMVDRKIQCMKNAFLEYEKEAEGYAGPACFEVFGEDAFCPESKEEAYRLSERQQSLTVEYSSLSNSLINEFVNQEERSYTIIAYPVPAIGEQFEEIFEAVREVNTLDNKKYCEIQQKLIETLDQAKEVHIMGRGKNMTNLTIALTDLCDIKTQTKFENCLADVNIPVGEVFTSPKLKGTNGLLHVTEVFLNGLCYKDLRITLEDGKVVDYSCGNFEDPEKGKAFIKENILYNRETLPVGEFAIGTNTTAYVMATKYGIMDKLPILIAEKMGPHLALGDTCYSYSEEVKVYNPDGREIIAKDNECSILRLEDPKKAYFNCHTDITIPYEELDRIAAVLPNRVEIPLILDGRFVLEGTWELNDPFKVS